MAGRKRGAKERVERVVRGSDVVLEVVDARAVETTRCRHFERLAQRLGKALVIVINKSDLADAGAVAEARARLSRELPCVAICAKTGRGRDRLKGIVRAQARGDRHVAVIGYPNVGKSSVINMLTRRGSARTSPEPGFTRGEQWVRLDEHTLLLDTPGVVPRDEDVRDLLLIGAWDVDKVRDPVPAAWALLERLASEHPEVVERYGGDSAKGPEAMLEDIARARGKLQRGGEPDVEEMARCLIRDWHRGRIVRLIRGEG